MKTFQRILTLLLALTMMVAVLCACGDSSPVSSQPKETPTEGSSVTEPDHVNELTVGIAQDLDESLDPHSTTAAGTREVFFNLFEGLVKPDTDGNLIPAVASDYVIADTGDTFTFTLREGVKFHDGSVVTVGDVVYSISRVAGLETGTPLISTFSAVESVEATDDQTVVIKTKEPYLEFISFLTCAIIPEGSDPADGLIGTGPFKFVSRTPQVDFVIEKFDDYWGEPAYLDKVTFKIIENSSAVVTSIKSGAVDLFAHLTASQAAEVGQGFTVLEGNMNLVQALYLNNAYGPLQDVRVRQALCYAVDRQSVLDFLSDGMGAIIGSSLYPSLGKYYEDLSDYYTLDIEKAKSLLAEAGYPNGFDLEITVPSNYQFHVDTAQVLAEQLKAIGVNCTIRNVEWSTWLDEVYSQRNYQSTIVGFDSSSAMTAQAMLARFQSGSSKNMCNFADEEFDEVYAQALACTDEAQQIQLYKRLQTILAEQAANVYIQDPCDLVVMRSDITGYQFYPIYILDLSKIHFVD